MEEEKISQAEAADVEPEEVGDGVKNHKDNELEESAAAVVADVSESLPGDETTEFHKPVEVAADGQNHQEKKYNIFERQAIRVSRSPCTYFWVSFLSALVLGTVGMIAGKFEVAADNNGWNSRGTLISDRHTQFMLIDQNRYELWSDTTGAYWQDLIDNVQPGWETDDDDDGRRLEEWSAASHSGLDDITSLGHRLQRALQMQPMRAMEEAHHFWRSDADRSHLLRRAKKTLPRLTEDQVRLLNTLNSTEGTLLEGCDVSWYTSSSMYDDTRLWPVWRTKSSSDSFFDSNLLHELCEQEQGTQNMLEDQGLCETCGGSDKCLLPYSPVFYARLTVTDGMTLSCEALATKWTSEGHEEAHRTSLQECVDDLLKNYNIERDGSDLPESCPFGFFPTILDEKYPNTEVAEYTSTIFATKDTDADIEKMYDIVDDFPSGQIYTKSAYDTQYEDFVELSLDDQLLIDMSLACGSAFVTFLAMMIHTRSPFLTFVGLAQIIMSFPLAFFFYTFIARLEFFPFLNFIGIFVIFALGADDVFVAVDKWKNARLKNPDATVEEIAAIAMPDAAMAMLLTTITTAVAFFGTAVCPVAPILCFAVFCGLLVILDYILCVLLVFPALCIYDQAENRDKRCCCHCSWVPKCKCCSKKDDMKEHENDLAVAEDAGEFDEEAEENVAPDEAQAAKSVAGHNEPEFDESLIHRLLRGFYKYLHLVRWPLLAVCAAVLVVCAVKAAQIELPTSADVRLYDPEDNQYEQNFVWRKNLLFEVLEAKGGSSAYVIWGVSPGDNGDLNNPETWSSLLLDGSFNPAETKAQEYLLNYCDRFFDEDFAAKTNEDFECPINRFDWWLQEQFASSEKSQTYLDHCDGAEKLPMAEEKFDDCFYNWGQLVRERTVLARDGRITSMYFAFTSRVRYDSPFSDLRDEWKLIEDWMGNDQATAPSTAKNAYFTSEDFWWYDTNGSMLDTAFQSAGIAMGAAAAVILFSSRSVVLTIFSTVTVGYVLTSVTAMLVGIGWTLGFLESILFAILIGISCDFVIHFSHAYSHLKGHRHREERTLFALLSMGPSVLAAAFTTFSAACVMLATVITFFEKFAVILFLTVLQALVGSFIVFLTMTVCLGPSDPTYLIDRLSAKCASPCGRQTEIQGDAEVDA